MYDSCKSETWAIQYVWQAEPATGYMSYIWDIPCMYIWGLYVDIKKRYRRLICPVYAHICTCIYADICCIYVAYVYSSWYWVFTLTKYGMFYCKDPCFQHFYTCHIDSRRVVCLPCSLKIWQFFQAQTHFSSECAREKHSRVRQTHLKTEPFTLQTLLM